MTIDEATREAAAVLDEAGVNEARREAGSLLGFAIERERTFLLTHGDEALSPEELARVRRFVERRAAGEPLQYITGRQEFYGLPFEVTPDVLIPRPETELLVETALEIVARDTSPPQVCDVGTGSGCIVIALLHERPDARGTGIDVSAAALAVAARNARLNGVFDRLSLVESDCFAALGPGQNRFSLILSNPPYVAESDLSGLQREVRDFEPQVALTPGGDGLGVIRRLLAEAPRFLVRGGHLLFEIGFNQHARVHELIDTNCWTLLDIHKDLQGIPRTVALRLN